MMSIQGRVARAIGLTTFADITSTPLFMPGGVDRDGLLFNGALTDEQVESVWWRMTSADDMDQAKREGLYVRLGEAVAVTPATWEAVVLADILRYQLGLQ